MTYSYDFSNDKPDIRAVIPAGTPLLLQMTFTPGGVGPDGALTASKETDAVYLKAEFTVLRGPYKGRKIWGNLTVSGGKVDEKNQSVAGKITRQTIRCIIDSSQGIRSDDETPEANAKRVLPNGFRDLQGRRFVAKAKVEKANGNYPEKNGLGQVLTSDMKGYPSEAELDNPAVGAAVPATAAIPAPAWDNGGQTVAQERSNIANAAAALTNVAVGATIALAEVVAPAAAPAQQTTAADAIPAWAKAA